MADIRTYTEDELSALLPIPENDAHKYSRGRLVLAAGCASYPGAACLAARAGMRTGAGYTQVICAPESVPVVQAAVPSAVARSWGSLASSSRFEEPEPDEAYDTDGVSLRPILSASPFPHSPVAPAAPGNPVAFVVGPGFDGRDGTCRALTMAVLGSWAADGTPVVVDGGAISAVATQEGRRVLRNRTVDGAPTIITPHAGEAARLARAIGSSVTVPGRGASEEELGEYACNLARFLGCIIVLKGADTYISDGFQVIAAREGTPALAKAGTGDVLAGMIGALLAQGLEPLDAAVLGATLHARAGREAEAELTSICVTPEDVIERIPDAVKSLLSWGIVDDYVPVVPEEA